MEAQRNLIVNHRKKILIFSIVFVTLLAGTTLLYIRYRDTHISTNDAFITGRVHVIAPKVSGTIAAVHVNDNQLVNKGDILFEIDETDYNVKVEEVKSNVEAEKSRRVEIQTRIDVTEKQLQEARYRIDAARANLDLQEANLKQAKLDIERAERLLEKDAVARERYDRAKTAYDGAVAQKKAARDQWSQAEAYLETQKAVIKQTRSALTSQDSLIRQKEAMLEEALLRKGYTKIYAPVGGQVSKKAIEVGNQVQAGQPVMAIVPMDDIWVVANYKETQLENVKPGQEVEVRVDTYPDKKFMGKVDSIMAGTGAVFSLFPPENATGNYVKVVQRIPVKIVFDQNIDREHTLRVGMSVEPTILLR
jgi:membrane fusion protein, multidrug efflux system